jgi:hypothetical protein
MTETSARRRGHGEDAIYFAKAKNRYVGAISLGYGPDGKRIRRKVFGKTKQEVRDRLKALHQEMDAGLRSSSTYTVRETVEHWLREGLDGTSERTRTLYEGLLGPLLEVIGAKPLRALSASDVRAALGQLTAATRPGLCRSPGTRWSVRSVTPSPTTSSGATWQPW